MTSKIVYLGHSGFLIRSGNYSLVIDPYLTGNPLAAMETRDITADYVILTHGHSDHLGDGIEIARNNDATLIAPYELAMFCQFHDVKNVHPMHIGGSYQFPFGTLKLTLAAHGSAVIEGTTITYTGNPCGLLLFLEKKILYHAGDTGIFYDMRLIGEMHSIDLALLPIGGNFTMDVADAVKAVELLNPKLSVPMHYNTFGLIKADPGDFVARCEQKGFNARILDIGAMLEL